MSPVAVTETLLRTARPDTVVDRRRTLDLVLILLAGGFLYGAVMGSSSLRPSQALYSGLKVPILLTASCIVCLPSFFVVNTLLGLRGDVASILRGIVSAQVTMVLVLASLAPLTAFAYLSSDDYHFAVVWNGVMFLCASLAGHVQLRKVYVPLVAANPRHRVGRFVWLTLYMFVTIQLAWMLRPFIGWPELETTFFRQGVWDNAYVVVVRDVWTLLSR